MTAEDWYPQIKRALADLKAFAEKSTNIQLLDHVRQLEESLSAITAAGDMIKVGDISGSTAVAIGHDINIIVNQMLTPELHESWKALQGELSQVSPEIGALAERHKGGHVFLSYSRHDMDKALQIRRALEAAGHIVWQDLTAIKGGVEWIGSIEEGVERSYALVTVVSDSSRKSEWVQIEYLHAKRRNKPIVPIRIDSSEIPTMMLTTHVIPGYPDLEDGIRQLLEALPAPPPEGAEIELPADRRALEIRYLDKLLLEHSVWQEVYTPMAGVGQLRVEEERRAAGIRMKTTPTIIDVGYLGQKLARCGSLDELPVRVEEKHYEADIVPAVEEMRQLIILGDPGAGKTTTLWKILSDYAKAAKDDSAAPLPIFVQLGTLGGYESLEAAIKAQLGRLAPHYDDLLREKHLAFLLDGLNELPRGLTFPIAFPIKFGGNGKLQEIRELIQLCQTGEMVAVVTCRELDYVGVLDLGITERVTVKPLDPIRIRRFVNAYIEDPPGKGDELFWQLAGEDARARWEWFERAVGESEEVFWLADELPGGKTWGWLEGDNRYWERWRTERYHPRSMLTLASNPYMLYMMTQVFTQTGTLPRNRGLLFQTFIDYLLEKRERLSETYAGELKLRLAGLAYAMQAKGEGTTFSGVQVMEHLKDEQCLYHARSASILSDGTEVRFTHQLLQEYFAAHRLQLVMGEEEAKALFPPGNWWEPQGWEETVILLAGLYNDDCSPVIDWLKEAQPEVASRCIVEGGAHTPDETLARLRDLWLPRLTDWKGDPQPQARAAVGRALGRLRLEGKPLDNRPGVGIKDALPDIDWVPIPGVEGWPMVDDDGNEIGVYDIAPFCMAKYPITYAQFRAFVEDDFSNPRWWAGLDAPDEHRAALGEQRFEYDNHPRERVSCWDAMAFCAWLSAKLDHPTLHEWLEEGRAWTSYPGVRLPTEWEWQWAAQGPDGREYPYAGPFDASKGNTAETGIGGTSAVGIFPQGASPQGVLDMSGNVWEWCLNEYDKPGGAVLSGNDVRVVRGGSWDFSPDFARCSYRYWYFPFFRYGDVGFRVVVVGCSPSP